MAEVHGLRLVVPLLVCVLVACSKSPDQAKYTHLKRGNDFAAKQQYDQAIIEYRNAVRADPKFGEARLRLGEAYVATGVRDRAATELARAADLMPGSLEAQIKSGNALLVTGQFSDAEARADRVLKSHGNVAQALLLKGYALAGLRRTEDAVKQIEEAIALNPSAMGPRVSLGALLLREGNIAAAEVTFKRALAAAPQSLDAHLALGQYYWVTRRYSEAERILLAGEKLQPGAVTAKQALASFYLSTGREAQAEPYVKAMAEQSPRGALTLADYYVAMQREDDAREVLRRIASAGGPIVTSALLRSAALDYAKGARDVAHRAVDDILRKSPRQVDALALKARFLLAERQLAPALERARAAVAIDPEAAQAQYVLGLVHLALNDRQAAAAAFTEVTRINPRAADAQTQLAALQLERGRPGGAVTLAEAARRNAPQSRDAHLILVRGLIAQGDGPRADVESKALLDRNPEWAPAFAARGVVELRKRNFPAASDAFTRALAMEPDSRDALQGLVAVKVLTNQPAEGRALLEHHLARNPRNADVIILLAELDIAAHDYAAAERNYLRALEVNKDHLGAYSRLALIYAKQRRLDEGRQKYEQIVARQPKDTVARTMVAVLLQVQNRTDDAIRQYEQILQIDRRSAVAANNLAYLYADRGTNLDIALQLAQTAKQELPDVTGVTDTLGWVYYKKKLSAQAIAAFEEITRAEPQNAIYYYHLGLAHRQAGDAVRARRALEETLKLQPNSAEATDARKVLATLPSAS